MPRSDDIENIELRRAALYEKVWEEPVTRLAARYGISDVALRKICRKLGVPTPPRGYWAKLRHGHEVRRAPLPPLADGAPEVHVIYRRPERASSGGAAATGEGDSGKSGSSQKAEKGASAPTLPEIRVSSRLRRPHPLVAKAREALKKARPDRYGRVRSFEGLAVSVCPESTGRALRLLDALLKAAEKLGWAVEEQQSYKKKPCFALLGEQVPFRLMERVRQERRKVEGDPWREWEYTYHPTGRLRLEITSSSAPRSKWTDGKPGPALEERLGAFLEGVFEAAQAAKKWRRDREEEERERQEAERRRLEAQKRREAEAARRRALEAEAEGWHKSQKLRAYIEEVERRALGEGLSEEEREAFGQWLAWARGHAARLDPLSKGLPFTEEGLQRKGSDQKVRSENAAGRAAPWFTAESSYWRRFG